MATARPTRVVNIRREMHNVYVGRAGHGYDGYFGNPFHPVGDGEDARITCIEQFRDYFHRRMRDDVEYARRILELRGKKLGCFCKPKVCHADIIAEYLNNLDGNDAK
jgi:hypothetical protein